MGGRLYSVNREGEKGTTGGLDSHVGASQIFAGFHACVRCHRRRLASPKEWTILE